MPNVRRVEPGEAQAWDELIAASPQGNTFLRWEWLHMLSETDPSLTPLILGCYDDGDRLLGGHALLYQERWGLQVTPPFEFFYSGPVVAPPRRSNHARAIADENSVVEALAHVVAQELDVVEVEAHPLLTDVRPYLYAGWRVEPAYTHIWRTGDREQAWEWMDRDKRRQIRKGEQDFDFQVEDGSATLDEFLPLYGQTMRKFSWRPSARWQAIMRERLEWMEQRDGCRLYTARTRAGELVAGVMVLMSRDDGTAYLWRQGSNPDYVPTGVIPALYWRAALAVADELPYVNFGGSPLASLSHFKDTLGADPVAHFCLYHTYRPGRLKLIEGAQRAKDRIYNLVMPLTFGLYQRLRYGRAHGSGETDKEPVSNKAEEQQG